MNKLKPRVFDTFDEALQSKPLFEIGQSWRVKQFEFFVCALGIHPRGQAGAKKYGWSYEIMRKYSSGYAEVVGSLKEEALAVHIMPKDLTGMEPMLGSR